MSPWVILIFATRGFADLVENALTGIVRCGIDPGIVHVWTPPSHLGEIEMLAARFGARAFALPGAQDQIGAPTPDNADYATRDFRILMGQRLPVVRDYLTQLKFVLHTDADVSWLRNPLDYLQHVLSGCEWTSQVESVPQYPPAYSFGFYAVRPTWMTRKLINNHIARYNPAGEIDDQTLFRELLIERPRWGRKVFPLPESLFPCGLLLDRMGDLQDTSKSIAMADTLRPFVVHANWTVGIENKRRLLKKAGAWLI